MSKKDVKQEKEEQQIASEEEKKEQEQQEQPAETTDWQKKYEEAHDAHLRLAAEYDNFRKRTVKEKDQSYGNGKADTLMKLLPVYDNLERALNQPTEDEAYKKGVEMTMNELVNIFKGLGVEIYGDVGDAFDPNMHNAIMHAEDETLGENVIAQVFQKGFRMGDKVIRFAMVQVAN